MQSIRQHRRWQPLHLAAGLLAALALPVSAGPLDSQRDRAPAETQRVDLVQASRIARMELGGEIIKAELTRYRGTEVYMVRLLDQGRVREALVDAATGAMLSPGQSEEAE
ncbi:PepSY domain-containing protein [Marinobacterium maritimum]|uniref:PepSY domain-containing protein n=1 Tax=Marinobacterium maritimum TaxID=500162 RepID=UPI0031D99553